MVTVHERERFTSIRYAVPRWSPSWAIPEVPVPESELHDQAIEYVRSLLLAWAARTGRHISVLRNIGIRWVPSEPRSGFDPDLCLLDPAPDLPEGLNSLRLWDSKIAAPRLALEIVSPNHPYKDYVDTPERAAACGLGELWVYDPLLAGPATHGGPFLIQLWRREHENFERVHAGDGPAYSRELRGWLQPRRSRVPAGALLGLSDAKVGKELWPTLLEQERQRAETAELRADAAERELTELRAKLEGAAAEEP